MSRQVALPLLACALCASCAPEPPAIAPGERSLVLITLDTTRADRIGAYGGEAVPTPRLDRVADEGVLFEQAISQVPLTLPAHASLMTGRYPASLGVRHNGIYTLPAEALTLAERLGEAGWDTAAFIAAYVLNRGFGVEQGFETFNDVPVNRYEGGEDQLFRAQRTADEVNEQVFRWLDRRKEGKFFLWVHYYDPHDPYRPPERDGRALSGSGYDREISYVDACLGDLLDRLRQDGLLDRSVLAIVGDHGESLGEHGEKTHGIFLYEGAVHVPMMIRAPGLVPAGRRVSGPVELVDVAPTLLDLLDERALERAQGRSLLPRILGERDEGEALAFAETLMPRIEFGWSELYMVHDGRFKYVRAPQPELYDLEDDPDERANLLEREPRLALEMAAILDAWLSGAAVAGADAAASRTITPEEEERLRGLGYLGGSAFKEGQDEGAPRPDPKRMIAEVRALDAARDLLAAGDAEGALEGARSILAANPGNHQARTTEVLALIELDRLVEAEKAALEALRVAREADDDERILERKARGLLASVYNLAGNTAQAERQYRALLKLDPGQTAARVDLARLLMGMGQDRKARALVDEVLDTDPRDGMALALLFKLQQSAGERDAAIDTAMRLSRDRAGDAETLVQAAQLLMESGNAAAAVPCLEAAIEQVDGLPVGWLGRLGVARLESGDLDGAEQAFGAVARLRPADPRAFYYLGNIALRRGDEDTARRRFGEALRIDPGFVDSQLSLSRWLAAQGRLEEAVAELEKAAARQPGNPRVRRELDALRRGGAGGGGEP